MAAHGKQSEKCRREATWLDGKPYLQSYPMVSTPEFDPDSGQTKMGQIWVNSQKKAKPPQSRKARGWFSAADFSEKQCYLYNRYC